MTQIEVALIAANNICNVMNSHIIDGNEKFSFVQGKKYIKIGKAKNNTHQVYQATAFLDISSFEAWDASSWSTPNKHHAPIVCNSKEKQIEAANKFFPYYLWQK